MDIPPKNKAGRPKKSIVTEGEHYNAVWIENRKRFRKRLTGTRLTLDKDTGYLEPVGRDGFLADDRRVFIERFKVCDNIKQICISLNITEGTVYDAIVVDTKFRNDVNACFLIPNREHQLNNGLKDIKRSETESVLKDLFSKAKEYGE